MPRTIRLALLGPLLAAGLSVAQPAVELGPGTDSASLAGHLALLRDPGGTLGIAEAVRADGWSPLRGGLALGYTKDAVWLRFDVDRDPGAPPAWLLAVGESFLDDVRVYSPGPAGTFVEQRSGALFPREMRRGGYGTPVFKLQLQPGTQRVLVRIRSRSSVVARVELHRPESFASEARAASVAWGLFFGAMAALVLFQAAFWIRTREPVTGWYAAYIVLYAGCIAVTVGLPQQYLGAEGPAVVLLRGLSLAAVVGVGSIFNSLALELPLVLPRFNRLFLWTAALTTVGGAGFVVLGSYGTGASIAMVGGLLLIASLLCVAVALDRRGHRPARLFLVAFGLFFAGIVLRFFRNLGLIPPGPLVDNGIHLGALANLVTMSIGLSGRFSRLKREAAAAQAEALAATRRLNETLEEEVATRTAELTREIRRRGDLEEELRRALEVERLASEEQRDFVAMVSHEFRNPLSIIGAASEQLAEHPDAPRERVRRWIAAVAGAADRMTSLVDDFLASDRMSREERHLDVRPSSLRLVVARAVAELPEGRVAVAAGDLPERFPCDPELLQVALRNLLANAERHSPAGCPVSLAARVLPDGGIELTVTDRGPGIPPDELPHLFRKYFRGRGARGSVGVGLGLYLVDRIARRHGGSVSVESSPGAGATFRLRIPASPPEPDGLRG